MNKTLPSTTTLPNEKMLSAVSHLQNSSQLLLHKCPALSAYLEAQRSAATLQSGHGLQNHQRHDDGSHRICRTCGSTMIPGWSCRNHRQAIKKTTGQKQKRSKSQSRDDSHIAYRCDLCHSVNRFKRRENQVTINKSVSTIPTPKTVTAPTIPAKMIEETSSSSASVTPAKKRSKKAKSGGLAAMLQLAKAKNQSSSSSGFDLMDFMKSA